jgi:small subunit ribosomal protein S18
MYPRKRSEPSRDSNNSERGNNASSESPFSKKKKSCPFVASKVDTIDYKDVDLLRQFITERGKILPRRITGVSYFYQKVLKKAIKQARYMALLPFVAKE